MDRKKVVFGTILFLAILLIGSPVLAAGTIVTSQYNMEIYGFVKADFMYDDAGNAVGELLSFTNSDVDTSADFRASGRMSRLGFKISKDNFIGKVEGDFYGLGGSHTGFRLRHAYGKVNMGNFEVLLGQTWHLTPLELPGSNNFMCFGYNGALWHRVPQARLTYNFADNFSAAVAVAHPTNDVAEADNEATSSEEPLIEAQISKGFGFGELTLSGAMGTWEDTAGESGDIELVDLGYSFDLPASMKLNGQIWSGQNLQDFLGSPGMGYAGNEVEAKGGFANLTYDLGGKKAVNLAYGVSNPDENSSIQNWYSKNTTMLMNYEFPLASVATLSVEYARNTTEYSAGDVQYNAAQDEEGDQELEDNHFQFSAIFPF